MEELKIIFIANILIIQGLNFLFKRGQLLGFIPDLYDRYLGTNQFFVKLGKPLFYCTPCMSSLWGVVGFFVTNFAWYYYPVWAICLCGANVIISKTKISEALILLFNHINSIKSRLKKTKLK